MYQLVYYSTLSRLKYNIRNLTRYSFNDNCDLSQKLRFSMLTIIITAVAKRYIGAKHKEKM